jgi:hypothetical protein
MNTPTQNPNPQSQPAAPGDEPRNGTGRRHHHHHHESCHGPGREERPERRGGNRRRRHDSGQRAFGRHGFDGFDGRESGQHASAPSDSGPRALDRHGFDGSRGFTRRGFDPRGDSHRDFARHDCDPQGNAHRGFDRHDSDRRSSTTRDFGRSTRDSHRLTPGQRADLRATQVALTVADRALRKLTLAYAAAVSATDPTHRDQARAILANAHRDLRTILTPEA